VSTTVTHCDAAAGYGTLVATVWPWVDASVYSFIPLVVIVTLNSLIIRHVVAARRVRGQLSSFRAPSGPAATGQRRLAARMAEHLSSVAVATTALAGSKPARSDVHGMCQLLQGQDARMIALLLTVSFTFLAATLPRCAILIATEFINRSLPAALSNVDDPQLYEAKIFGATQKEVGGVTGVHQQVGGGQRQSHRPEDPRLCTSFYMRRGSSGRCDWRWPPRTC